MYRDKYAFGQNSLLSVLRAYSVFNPEVTESETHARIISAVGAAAEMHPGSRIAICLCVSLAGRMDDTVLQCFLRLGMCFGRAFLEHSLMIWTHGDLIIEQPTSGTTGSEASDYDAALSAYLDGVGDSVAEFLGNVRGGSLVLTNVGSRPSGQELGRVAEKALPVAVPWGQGLAPPRPHRKQARRERQQALLQDLRVERAAEQAALVEEGVGVLNRMFAWLFPAATTVHESGEETDRLRHSYEMSAMEGGGGGGGRAAARHVAPTLSPGHHEE